MTEPVLQLDLLAAAWTCTTCNGTGKSLRLLYPSEREPGGPFVTVRRCPTCFGARTLDYDPDDLAIIPF